MTSSDTVRLERPQTRIITKASDISF